MIKKTGESFSIFVNGKTLVRKIPPEEQAAEILTAYKVEFRDGIKEGVKKITLKIKAAIEAAGGEV